MSEVRSSGVTAALVSALPEQITRLPICLVADADQRWPPSAVNTQPPSASLADASAVAGAGGW